MAWGAKARMWRRTVPEFPSKPSRPCARNLLRSTSFARRQLLLCLRPCLEGHQVRPHLPPWFLMALGLERFSLEDRGRVAKLFSFALTDPDMRLSRIRLFTKVEQTLDTLVGPGASYARRRQGEPPRHRVETVKAGAASPLTSPA